MKFKPYDTHAFFMNNYSYQPFTRTYSRTCGCVTTFSVMISVLSPIPAVNSAKKLFRQLFAQGKPEEAAANVEALRQGRSMLDFVGEDSQRLRRSLSKPDQQRMEQYFTSVRELEQRLHSAEAWEHKPKPVVAAQVPEDINDAREFLARTRMMFDVMNLALGTDSTRFISTGEHETQDRHFQSHSLVLAPGSGRGLRHRSSTRTAPTATTGIRKRAGSISPRSEQTSRTGKLMRVRPQARTHETTAFSRMESAAVKLTHEY